ncbi:hypothetical protein [Frondihabitans cladoniiphilus]|uniref:Uncharacterized protein n=1 Tax=Frondihabitans cladoniiphilus TaxID=715785 RepID=A0ABP8WB50_9MICO
MSNLRSALIRAFRARRSPLWLPVALVLYWLGFAAFSGRSHALGIVVLIAGSCSMAAGIAALKKRAAGRRTERDPGEQDE